MPPSSPSEVPGNGPNLGIIFAAVVGAGVVVGIATGIYLHIARARKDGGKKGSQQSTERFSHEQTSSDASDVPLLNMAVLWKADERSHAPDEYSSDSYTKQWQKRNSSAESLETVKPPKDEKFIPPSSTQTQYPSIISDVSHLSNRNLPPLSIPAPPNTPHVPSDSMVDTPSSPYAPSSAGSASSISLYSQVSALPREPTFETQLMPPMVPQYSNENDAEEDTLANTILIGKLLKKRAKRNPNKITRSVSRIERVGSIKTVTADEDEEEDLGGKGVFPHERQASRRDRSRRTRSKHTAAVTLVSSNTAAKDTTSSPTVPVIPSPPATLDIPSWIHTPPPQRAHSFLLPHTTPLSLSHHINSTSHQYSSSLDEQGLSKVQGPFLQNSLPKKAHVRQYSAERVNQDAVGWPSKMSVSLRGVVGA